MKCIFAYLSYAKTKAFLVSNHYLRKPEFPVMSVSKLELLIG